MRASRNPIALVDWTGILYAGAVSFTAGLASLVIVVILAEFAPNSEYAMGYGIIWFFLLPWILMAGVLGRISFPWYRARRTVAGAATVFVATVFITMIGGALIGYWFFWVVAS